MLNRQALSFVGAVGAVFLIATQADAHARVVASTPAASATVNSTRSISVTFSERVAPAFSGLDLVGASGSEIAVTSSVSADGKTITGQTARPLSAGAYTVNWRAASADGHRMTGNFTFTVR
ncbi:MAG: copper homeostasis periplasmic binding protein CopC [Caulobacteraceae bacterium]|jgi:copper resistance protein C|uniref:copper homeostasis periplasmic binding protein CopC n=1 Tax=Brevundimonas bacteroides TaxID=74311 RepID=UPI000496AE6A|nr:copper homeostasis periplasmic binding protein CopC [Brevundimonas bacteroides]MBU1326337.1 copper homeostasis periplasmic binding protein CopC [Alphaproteobacteria bacterium]MBX9708096.1 copper homeostasis periplasmic binding protein CopC [Caulobacteraceae bacterium]MBU1525879.1 copper homeostasis periplasmic binding protein CopC [Alphaproteobacteria bacterium]MBU2117226.1 copper homeostasis periplasmic binding protein CopC [Alphaproteobacteria bacterium]MBU2350446.1 copper homeostasis per